VTSSWHVTDRTSADEHGVVNLSRLFLITTALTSMFVLLTTQESLCNDLSIPTNGREIKPAHGWYENCSVAESESAVSLK